MPALVWKGERNEQKKHVIAREKTTVGRLPENDFVLADNLVSRKHCTIEHRGDLWFVVDHDSRYGTYVNDEKVTGERVLNPGDRLRLGNTPLQFLVDDDEAEISETGHGASTRAVSAAAKMVQAKDLADQVLRYVENPSSDRRTTLVAARELVDRVIAAEKAFGELERDKLLGQTLATVGHLMTMVTNVDDVLKMTLEQAVRALGAERGFVLLREGGKLVVRVQKNMSAERGFSTSIAEQVATSGDPVLTTDAKVDPRFMEAQSVLVHDIRSVMCVPLRGSDYRVFGAIFVDGRPGNPMFGPEGVEFLKSFSSQAAFAFERAQLATKHRLEEQARQRLSGFFSPSVIDEILQGEEEVLGGKGRSVTVLFTDIRGFTTLLEKLSPAEAVEMLNDYFTELVDELLAEEATLDKFTGDGIMAFFGAPKEQPDHAIRAVRASLKMQARMPALLARWQKDGRSFAHATSALATGIGIHSGEAVVGRIGSPRKKDYTAIGDTVNTAARVQAIAGGGEVLVTAETAALLGGAAKLEKLPPMALKGKSREVEIWRVIALV